MITIIFIYDQIKYSYFNYFIEKSINFLIICYYLTEIYHKFIHIFYINKYPTIADTSILQPIIQIVLLSLIAFIIRYFLFFIF